MHQEQKDPRPGDPQTPGCIPHPEERQDREPQDMGAKATETTQ